MEEFTTTRDQLLVRQAIRGRWPISPSIRVKIVRETEHILDKPESDDKLKLLAARTLVQIDGLNLREDEIKIKAMPKHHIHTNMTTEELQAAIQEKMETLGLTRVPQDAIPKLLEAKQEGKIK